MNKSIAIVFFVVFAVFMGLSVSAADLTDEDKASLKTQNVVEHFWYDSYLGDNKGLYGSLSWELDLYLNDNIFLLGYTAWATTGKCGGFGIGVGGIGYDAKLSETLSWQTKISGGTGGGKYIDKSGLILLLNTGPRLVLVDGFDLDLKVGYLKFLYGTYSVPTFSFGISYSYSLFSL